MKSIISLSLEILLFVVVVVGFCVSKVYDGFRCAHHDAYAAVIRVFPSRESDEQPSDEHAQCQWIVDATSKDRAVRGTPQGRGGRCHGHWTAMIVTSRRKR